MLMKNDLRMALDGVLYAKEKLGFEPDGWQQQVLRSSSKRLLLNCSRQAGKSTIASMLSLHRAMYWPGSLIILISPSLRQSSELFRKITDVMGNMDTKPKMVEDNKLSFRMENGSRVVSLPSSAATIRGFSGVDLIIEDEAAQVDDELYRSVRPMLATTNGGLVLMSTPFGKRGHFFEEWQGNSNWERIKIKASQCPRITSSFLEDERASLGNLWYRQEYCCEFLETSNQLFSYELVMEAMDSAVIPLFATGL